VTDSEHSRADIVRHLAIPAERVRVIPLGVSDEFQPPASFADEEALDALRQRYGLSRPFVLNVGGFDARKRLPQLVRGFAAALPRLDEDFDLVIVGRAHTANPTLYPPLAPLLRELGVEGRVRLVGFVSEADKRDFYRAATVFAFVSEYEGFGFNPLEAMACGAPVICSNRTSLPEIVGDAGLLIEPEPEAIADALVLTLSSPDLRADLSLRGLARAKQFTWARCAEQTIAAYAEALGAPGEQGG
jgi:glycosyltransferase involved in cell wall biosynthesis